MSTLNPNDANLTNTESPETSAPAMSSAPSAPQGAPMQGGNVNPYSQTNFGYNPYPQAPYTYPAPGTYPAAPQYPYPQGAPAEARPKKKGLGTGAIVAIILACAVLFTALGFFGSQIMSGSSASASSSEAMPQTPSDPSVPSENSTVPSTMSPSESLMIVREAEPMELTVAPKNGNTMSIPDVVDKTADSVVEITTEVVATSLYMQQYITSGAGSGIIISENGYILTNNHVIADATSITVTLKNGDTFPAALVGLDEDLDIALLKVDATGLTPAEIGTSSDLRVGQTIIAIGNPLGQLGGTVTSGIISALERSITIDGTTMSLMQIDAAVNPGNSGGALFDEEGTLVGVVNAKSSGNGVEGIGFAIPIDSVMEILDDLVNYGYVKGRPAIGITMVDISTSQMAYMYRVSELGPYIYSVNEGGSAEAAGLQSGDRILSVNGVAVSSAAEVKEQITGVSVGSTITMEVSRNNQTLSIKVVMGEYIPAAIRDRINN